MKCTNCEGRGFTELEHGLVMLECPDCNGTGEIDEGKESVLTEEMLKAALDEPAPIPLSVEDLEALSQDKYIESEKETDARNSRVGPADKPVRSRNPRKPKQPSKRKVKKQA